MAVGTIPTMNQPLPMKSHPPLEEVIVVRHPVKQVTTDQPILTKGHRFLVEAIVVHYRVKQAVVTQAPSMRWVEVVDERGVANAIDHLVDVTVAVVVTVLAATMMHLQLMENRSRRQGQGRELGDQLVEVELVYRTRETEVGLDVRSDYVLAS